MSALTASAMQTPQFATSARAQRATWQELDSLLAKAAAQPIDTKPPVAGESCLNEMGLLSTCVPFSDEWKKSNILIPHEPIRMATLLFERAVQKQYFLPIREWKVKRLFHWYATRMYDMIHHHHETEERIYFPFLAAKPGVVLPAQLSGDHVPLLALMKAIKDSEREFKAALSPRDDHKLLQLHAQLLERVTKLSNDMFDHLESEERDLPVLLEQGKVTQAEEAAVIQRIIKSLGPDMIKLLPELARGQMQCGGVYAWSKFIKNPPPPIQWHYKRFSHTWYETENLFPINSVCVDSDEEVPLPRSRGFWVFRWYPKIVQPTASVHPSQKMNAVSSEDASAIAPDPVVVSVAIQE